MSVDVFNGSNALSLRESNRNAFFEGIDAFLQKAQSGKATDSDRLAVWTSVRTAIYQVTLYANEELTAALQTIGWHISAEHVRDLVAALRVTRKVMNVQNILRSTATEATGIMNRRDAA